MSRYTVVKQMRNQLFSNTQTQYADWVFDNMQEAVEKAKDWRTGNGTDTYATFVYEVNDSFTEGEIPENATLIYES